jgi:hypothetical protein
MTRFMFGDGRPMPFLFLGKDYARTKNGAAISEGVGHSYAAVSSGSSLQTLGDGNRTTYCQIEDIRPRTGDYFTIYYDLSNVLVEGDRVDVIALECDSLFPVSALRISAYTDSGYSSGSDLTISHKQYDGDDYLHGVSEMVDGVTIGKPSHTEKPNEGYDGNYTIIFLEDAIEYTSPYVKIRVAGVGRNFHGSDGSFDNGLWTDEVAPPNGPTISTSTSYPDTIGSGLENYKLGLSGKSADQTTKWYGFRIRPESEYIFRFAEHKLIGSLANEPMPFRVEVKYYDEFQQNIGTDYLYKDGDVYSDGVWDERIIRINYLYGGLRYSGATEYGSTKHQVPDGTMSVSIRFVLMYAPPDSNIWRLDDLQLFRSDLHVDISETYKDKYDSVYFDNVNPKDVSGTVRIKRIGMFKYKFGLSDAEDYNPLKHDVGGCVYSNPQVVSDSITGDIYNRDPNGNIVGMFSSQSGPKMKRTFNMLINHQIQSELLRLFSPPALFGIVDINSNWGEVAGVASNINFNSLKKIVGDTGFDFSCSFTVEET